MDEADDPPAAESMTRKVIEYYLIGIALIGTWDVLVTWLIR